MPAQAPQRVVGRPYRTYHTYKTYKTYHTYNITHQKITHHGKKQ